MGIPSMLLIQCISFTGFVVMIMTLFNERLMSHNSCCDIWTYYIYIDNTFWRKQKGLLLIINSSIADFFVCAHIRDCYSIKVNKSIGGWKTPMGLVKTDILDRSIVVTEQQNTGSIFTSPGEFRLGFTHRILLGKHYRLV